MGHHTFDSSKADQLERPGRRFRFCSAEELLWALDPSGDAVVADLGSGTGFYTDVVAPHVGRVYAVDIQPEMHDYYREKGVPEHVDLVTSGVEDLPMGESSLDGAFSTMTYHEFAGDDALAALARVIRPGGRLVVFDWAADGEGDSGPPLAERYSASEAAAALVEAGFEIETEQSRVETFCVIAVRPE